MRHHKKKPETFYEKTIRQKTALVEKGEKEIGRINLDAQERITKIQERIKVHRLLIDALRKGRT